MTSALVATSLGLARPDAARAAGFVVDSTADTTDAAPGDGVCADASGACSLRAAVGETNALPGADTITIPAGTYDFGFPLSIDDDVTIVGAGSGTTLLRGSSTGDTIAIGNGPADLTVEGMTLRGDNDCIAVIASGGGSTVSVSNVVFEGCGDAGILVNVAGTIAIDVADSHFSGGGVSPFGMIVDATGGSVRASNTLVTATTSFGFYLDFAGGSADVDVADVTMENVRAIGLTATAADLTVDVARSLFGDSGQGVDLRGVATVTDSIFLANDIGVQWSDDIPGGSFTLSGSTISGGFDGVDVINTSGAPVTLTNVTVSGTRRSIRADSARVVHSTIVNPDGAGSSGYGISGGTVALSNSIVDVAGADDCSLVTIVSEGGNLDADGTCGLGQPSDQPATDAALGVLADNGGPTSTHLPANASPAIDAGVPSGCPATDQRGVARPQGAGCDSGAVELEIGAPLADVSVTVEPQSTAGSPVPVTVGEEFEVTSTVVNTGPDAAVDTVYTMSLSRGSVPGGTGSPVTAVSATTSQGTCELSAGSCTLGGLPAGGSVTIVWTYTADAVGTFQYVPDARTYGSTDPDTTNNRAATTFDIVEPPLPVADVSVVVEPQSTSGSPVPVTVGEEFEVTVTIKNDGPEAVSIVAGSFFWSSSTGTRMTVVSVTGSHGVQCSLVVLCSGGSLSPGESATWVWTVRTDVSGTYTFAAVVGGDVSLPGVGTIAVDDPDLTNNRATTTFEVRNQQPVATPDSYVTKQDTPLVVSAPGVLGNDIDPNGDPLKVVEAFGAIGMLTVDPSGAFTYVPALGFVGIDSFTYKVTDGNGGTATATVTIEVLPLTAGELLDRLKGDISGLDGLLAGEARSLLAKLGDQGAARTLRLRLDALVNELDALAKTGRISAADHRSLLDRIGALRRALSSSG